MSEHRFRKSLGGWNATGTGTTAGVTVTKAAVAGQKHVVTRIDCSGDAAAVVTIESPSGTVLWRKRFAAAFNMEARFEDGDIVAGSNVAILVKVSASTANSEANIMGYSIAG